ncbi:MAG: hypothetical protein ACRD20_02435 [Terriglobales bacterium]
MPNQAAGTAAVLGFVGVGSIHTGQSRVIAITGASEQEIRIALTLLRQRGQRDFRKLAPECWEEPLTSSEKQLFGKPHSLLCWCSELVMKPHTSQHYR